MGQSEAAIAMVAIVINANNVTHLSLVFRKNRRVMPLSSLYTQRNLWPTLTYLSLEGFKTR
jgi:hypothetical protein